MSTMINNFNHFSIDAADLQMLFIMKINLEPCLRRFISTIYQQYQTENPLTQ